MKKILLIMAVLVAANTTNIYGGRAMAAENNSGANQTITRLGTHPAYKGPQQFFTGTVWVQPLFEPKGEVCPIAGAYVTFEPGARSHWHNHPAGQHLIVTSGIGHTGTADGKVHEFKAGDTLWCPPGVKHWHGAAPDIGMTHLSLAGTPPDGKNTNWMEPVSDEQYKGGK